jgi:hypothetical protein
VTGAGSSSAVPAEVVHLATEIDYLDADANLADTVQDMTNTARGKGFAGKKALIREVGSAPEAHLVVEVVSRRARKEPLTVRATHFWVLYAVSLGGKVDSKQRRSIDWSHLPWREGLQTQVLHAYAAKEPFWKVEVYGEQRWANAGYEAVQVLDRFIDDNYEALTGKGGGK